MANIELPLSAALAIFMCIAAPGCALAYDTHAAGQDKHHETTTTSSATGDFTPDATAFLKENDAAMSTMMSAMAIKPSGDVDRDFVEMMIPHHQGAIDMAKAVRRYSRNDRIRRLAQEIIVTSNRKLPRCGWLSATGCRPPIPVRPRLRRGNDDIHRSTFNYEDFSMMRIPLGAFLLASTAFSASFTGQAPVAASASDIPVSGRDRVYAAEQFSNTVSVTNPATNKLLGVIRLGEPYPANFSPLYRGQVLVHGMGFSPDHRTLAIVSIGSNSVTFIDTATNAVKHTAYVGRAPHEAFFTPDGKEVWVTVRGEDYVAVLDSATFAEKIRIKVPAGPGMQIFSPDGKYGYICSSFNPEAVVISVADHAIVGSMKQDSPFCPDIATTPDGTQVWLTLKDIGRTMVFDARPPFALVKAIDTGPITNHVNFARTPNGQFAYVTIGGLNQVKVYRTDDFSLTATVDTGALPHGIWPSGDGSRMYVGLENANALAAIDTSTNKVVATIPVGQAPQAIAYVPNAVPEGAGDANLQPLGSAGNATQLALVAKAGRAGGAGTATSVTLFDQGLVQVLQAAVTGLEPKAPYVLALSATPDGSGRLEPLAAFMTNPAGSAVVNATGQIRQIVRDSHAGERRYLVVAAGPPRALGDIVQVQAP
ncbi:MAG: DUF305 domain-containing protein [Nitrosospira sp.]